MSEKLITPSELVEQVNAPIISETDAAQIVSQLTAMMAEGKKIEAGAQAYICETEKDTRQAKLAIQAIDAAVKQVESLLGDAKREAHKRHKLFTDAERTVLDSYKAAKVKYKMTVATWLNAEQEKARALQDQLQQQATQMTAQGDIVPEVIVDTPKADGIRLRTVWTAGVVNVPAFINAVLADPKLHQFIRFDEAAMAKAKTSYEGLEIPGVVFKQVVK